jgi:hypothetical protein
MNAGPVLPLAVTADLMMQVFDAPVSFHRCLIAVSGGVTAALMLSHAIAVTLELDPAAQGWFVKSREAWTAETGLTRWELETARRSLREAGLLQERRLGMPARLYYRVDADRVWQALQEEARYTCTLIPCAAEQEAGA